MDIQKLKTIQDFDSILYYLPQYLYLFPILSGRKWLDTMPIVFPYGRGNNMRFEWDEEKNKGNIIKHGISLEAATAVFNDPQLYEWHDVAHSGFNKYGV